MSAYLVFWFILASFGQCFGDCPDGFVSHQGSCYKTFDILANWAEAQTYCAAYGGFLVEITDQTEQHFITGYLQRLSTGTFNVGMFWMGGTDAGHEGQWVWSRTKASFTLTNWKNGEPNNAGSGENCLQISFRDGLQWNDIGCSNRLNFICQTLKNGGVTIIG